MKNNKGNIIVGFVFVFVSVVLVVAAVFIYKLETEYYKTALTADGTIEYIISSRDLDGDVDNDVFVRYSVDGTEYIGELNYYTSSMNEGDSIEVAYNLSDPTHVRSGSIQKWIFVVLGAMAAVFFIIGFVLMVTPKCFGGKGKKLKENGQLYRCEVIDVVQNLNISVNGVNPYNIICLLNINGERQEIKSKNIYEDLYGLDIKEVNVYVDRNNPKKYYVDAEAAIEETLMNNPFLK